MIRVLLVLALVFTTTAAEARFYRPQNNFRSQMRPVRQQFRPVQNNYARQYQMNMRQQGISAQRQMQRQYSLAYNQSMRSSRIR